jgi:hypothetical protein
MIASVIVQEPQRVKTNGPGSYDTPHAFEMDSDGAIVTYVTGGIVRTVSLRDCHFTGRIEAISENSGRPVSWI